MKVQTRRANQAPSDNILATNIVLFSKEPLSTFNMKTLFAVVYSYVFDGQKKSDVLFSKHLSGDTAATLFAVSSITSSLQNLCAKYKESGLMLKVQSFFLDEKSGSSLTLFDATLGAESIVELNDICDPLRTKPLTIGGN